MILIIIKLIVVLCSIKCILVLIDSKMSKDLKVVAVLGWVSVIIAILV